MSISYIDEVFAPIDFDHGMERLAGGNETEVYRTDDGRHVVKLKHERGGTVATALADARAMRIEAERFAVALGPRYSIPSEYIISRDTAGHVQVLVIQPFLDGARQLYHVDFAALTSDERAEVATQLRDIIRRSLWFYRSTGCMPDLYGRTSQSSAERARLNTLRMLPWRLWSFLVKRNLLRSHNLLLVSEPQLRVVLVDYDAVRRGLFYRKVYYIVRWFLFWRDHALILLMRAGKSFAP